MKKFLPPVAVAAALVVSMPALQQAAHAQGCVAAHSPQPVISGLDPGAESNARHYAGSGLLHGLTITTGFRTYSSYQHFIGTVEQHQRQTLHNAVLNHVDLFELDLNYQLTPRLSVIATIPGMEATRHGEGTNLNYYRSGGIGDVTVGAQTWIFRPPTESHGNVSISGSLKLPTGINDAKGSTTLANGAKQERPFDESIQPGMEHGDSSLQPRPIIR